jgi:hypothetical protein
MVSVPPSRHGIPRIDRKVEHRHFKLVWVGKGGRKAVRERYPHGDPRSARPSSDGHVRGGLVKVEITLSKDDGTTKVHAILLTGPGVTRLKAPKNFIGFPVLPGRGDGESERAPERFSWRNTCRQNENPRLNACLAPSAA